LLSTGFSDLAPTGAAAALLGGPLLLMLLPHLHSGNPATIPPWPQARRKLAAPLPMLFLLALAVLVLFGFVLSLGRAAGGWQLATGQHFYDLLPFRAPRTLVAATAGAMLGVAGFIMQRLTANPLASPEALGVSAGGGAGLTACLFLFAFPSAPVMLTAMALGALIALLSTLAISARGGFGPERFLLSGVAIGALSTSIVTVVLARGDMRGYLLLNWLSGSTNRVGAVEAWIGIVSAIVLIAPLPFLARWFAILPLGNDTGRSLGLPVAFSRLFLAVIAALLTAISSFLVGPLNLIGLVAPHLSRMLGFQTARLQLAASLLFGAAILVAADWLSRVAIFPYEVPAGLFAALLGGPYFIWLLTRKEIRK
jgi:iron complex transport system permease protein